MVATHVDESFITTDFDDSSSFAGPYIYFINASNSYFVIGFDQHNYSIATYFWVFDAFLAHLWARKQNLTCFNLLSDQDGQVWNSNYYVDAANYSYLTIE